MLDAGDAEFGEDRRLMCGRGEAGVGAGVYWALGPSVVFL